ncbi:sulfate ABC transporter substrate-binding protein [Aeromicrobium sp. CTD01-1L150]|uniref:sulfate ABC transporter substrate-binding protein n=1 Tax=Aeromicrobium sp. CTD01-1L150 TaxID=3341830 RepID=UPI0035C1CB7F
MSATPRTRLTAAAAAVSLGLLAACGGGSGSEESISIVGFAVPEAANTAIAAEFNKTEAGAGVGFTTSYGASGDQSRAVVDGLDADYVHLSVASDVERLEDADLLPEDWDQGDNKGIVSTSVVVLGVRDGNPKDIQGWDDLAEPDVDIVTPNPASSGAARWNALAAWGHVTENGGSEQEATQFLDDLFGNVVSLTNSGRDATQSFLGGTGDVLLAYENEAILAEQNGSGFEYVIPETTVLIENPGAVLADAVPAASDWLDFVLDPEGGQKQFALSGFRPLNPEDPGSVDFEAIGLEPRDIEGVPDADDPFPTIENLLTLENNFGGPGWGEVEDKLFGDGLDGAPLGIVAESIEKSGKASR